MGVVSMPVREAGGQEGCSHGLLGSGCATWWAHPWGKPSEGTEPAGADTGVFCPSRGLIWGCLPQYKTNLLWLVAVGFTQHKGHCSGSDSHGLCVLLEDLV